MMTGDYYKVSFVCCAREKRAASRAITGASARDRDGKPIRKRPREGSAVSGARIGLIEAGREGLVHVLIALTSSCLRAIDEAAPIDERERWYAAQLLDAGAFILYSSPARR